MYRLSPRYVLIGALAAAAGCGGGDEAAESAPEPSVFRIAFQSTNNNNPPDCSQDACNLGLNAASFGITRVELVRCADAQCVSPELIQTLFAGAPVRNDIGDLAETTANDLSTSVLQPVVGDVTVSGLRITTAFVEARFRSTEAFVGPQQRFRVCLAPSSDAASACAADGALVGDILVDLGDPDDATPSFIADGTFGFPSVAGADAFNESPDRGGITAWNVSGTSLGDHVSTDATGYPQFIALFASDVELRAGSGYRATLNMDWESTFAWVDDALNVGGGSGLWGFYYDGPFRVSFPRVSLGMEQTH